MGSSHGNNSLNIVFAASEAVPYAKTGGLADVVGALPVALAKLGHRVTVVVPCYRSVARSGRALRTIGRVAVPLRDGTADVIIEADELASGPGRLPVRVLALRYDPLFDRDGLYQNSSGEDYPDNLTRFAFFCRAVLRVLDWLASAEPSLPHILHLHDWQTALCAVYLKTMAHEWPRLAGTKTLLSLHNLGYQGLFPGDRFVETGLPDELFGLEGVEFYGSVNVLKGGILYADRVATVSPTYAKEILTPAYGFGLEGVLASRREGVVGITNGIDVEGWDPKNDPYLSVHYSAADVSGKRQCKRDLQRESGVLLQEEPLLGVIGRLTWQKGFDLLLEVLPDVVAAGAQVVVLGTGERELEQQFRQMQERFPGQVKVFIGFEEGRAHRIEAGADMLIMPSRYEPCGLSQLYSLRYGTVPVVRKTGGLADTVVPYTPRTIQERRATGFHFGEAAPEALLTALLLAIKVYQNVEEWQALRIAGMEVDSSWGMAATHYARLYGDMSGDE